VTDDTLGMMNRCVVLLALLGACAIDEHMFEQAVTTFDDAGQKIEGPGMDSSVVHDIATHEGGMDSGSGSDGSGSSGSGGSGSDGSGSGGSGSDGSGSDGSGSDGSGSDGGGSGGGSGSAGSGSGSGSGVTGNGGDDAGLSDINNDSDARTNFYACAGCGTSNPSQAGVLAFGVILVIRRRRR
jgi:hypothetical protein